MASHHRNGANPPNWGHDGGIGGHPRTRSRNGGSGDDVPLQDLATSLQSRLKSANGPLPTVPTIMAAILLYRGDAKTTRAACRLVERVPQSARDRVRQLAARVRSLLDARVPEPHSTLLLRRLRRQRASHEEPPASIFRSWPIHWDFDTSLPSARTQAPSRDAELEVLLDRVRRSRRSVVDGFLQSATVLLDSLEKLHMEEAARACSHHSPPHMPS